MASGISIVAMGAFILFIGYLNVLNIQKARKNGEISKTVSELGPHTYRHDRSPFQYWMHFWGSALALIVCSLLGVSMIGIGVFFVFESGL
jgi:hypothetical protein